MEFSKKDMKMLQGIAILFMLSLHLFARKEIDGLYESTFMINDIPLIYYIGLFGDSCVPIYLFVSGYGLSISLTKGKVFSKNFKRILKLLINFWIILFMFLAVGFLIGRMDAFPGGVKEFLLNFSLLSNSYNGAWWYLQTYVLLVLMAAPLIKLIKKNNSIVILTISGCIYFITYIQRIKFVIDFNSEILLTLNNALVLLGTSQFAFVIGMIFAKEKIYSKIYSKMNPIKYKNTLCVAAMVVLVIFHGIFETMFIAPFIAIVFICLFSFMDKKELVERFFTFFGRHSLNIWLTHMFFYISFFKGLIFAPYYPIIIFAWLIILCLITSYMINLVYQPVLRIIDNRAVQLPMKNEIDGQEVT